MKRNILLIFATLGCLLANALEIELIPNDWLKCFDNSKIDNPAILLKHLKGEDITIDISDLSNDLDCFLNVTPDTLWMKKAKNPVLNKHYKLISTYMGVEKGKTGFFYTPISAITDYSFHVDDVSSSKFNGYSALDCYCEIYLTNNQTGDRLIWKCGRGTIAGKVIIYSATLGSKIIGENEKYIYSTSQNFSKSSADYNKLNLVRTNYKLRIQRLFIPTLEIEYARDNSANTTKIEYKPNANNVERIKYIRGSQYQDMVDGERVYTLDVSLPQNVNYNFPFEFKTIKAKPSFLLSSNPIYQSIGKDNYLQDVPYGYLTESDSVIYIADQQKLHGVDYYIAICDNKCFYVRTTDIKPCDEKETAKLNTLISNSQEVRDNFFNLNKKLAMERFEQKKSRVFSEIAHHDKYGLSILYWNIYDQSKFTDGMGIHFYLINPSTTNTIKSVTFNVIGYNSINEKVSTVGKYIQTVRCVGPIEPAKTAEYNFDYVWFTDLVESAKIQSIIIQFMNGTTKKIANADSITCSDETVELFVRMNFLNLKSIE